MCKTFGVRKSGYCNWLKSGLSIIIVRKSSSIRAFNEVFKDSYQSYVSPRIKVALGDIRFLCVKT
jgi:hypothetical protein